MMWHYSLFHVRLLGLEDRSRTHIQRVRSGAEGAVANYCYGTI